LACIDSHHLFVRAGPFRPHDELMQALGQTQRLRQRAASDLTVIDEHQAAGAVNLHSERTLGGQRPKRGLNDEGGNRRVRRGQLQRLHVRLMTT